MRPTIWVSRCLIGDRVRYDGGHRHDARLAALAAHATLVPICPEVEAGLGVPRPPIDLVGLRVVDRAAGVDVTDRLDGAIDARLAGPAPHGFIGKGRSPSCGHGSARRFEPAGRGDGRLVQRLKTRWTDLPVCDIEDLSVEFLRAIWRRAGVEMDMEHANGLSLAIVERSERELLVSGRGGAAVRRRTTEDPS